MGEGTPQELRFSFSELYPRVNYSSPLPAVVNRITEYDIRSANTTMLRAFGVVRRSTIDRIEALPSQERKVAVGKMMLKKPEIKGIVSRGIRLAKLELFRSNLIQDDEVLSIRNDAVFIIGRRLRRTKFGVIEFRPKNVYSAYLSVEGIEFYLDTAGDRVDVKGISDSTVEHPDHQRGMVVFIRTVMGHLVYDRRDALRRYLIDFANDYKRKNLPLEYYREFAPTNIYRTDMELSGHGFNVDVAGEEYRDMINGVYNYRRFVLPLIQRYV